ncbi:hypothetical protein PVAP13_9KG197313 [Panicum virgatum]|uniref:Uncharacterized protein n=1 Tax=Panicum virgatum TaxID=38727 RepID=A0A8T0NL60_PANVG|nr:hypothetical protein PVAP13_9KG197313 [Panicum virgatum]
MGLLVQQYFQLGVQRLPDWNFLHTNGKSSLLSLKQKYQICNGCFLLYLVQGCLLIKLVQGVCLMTKLLSC